MAMNTMYMAPAADYCNSPMSFAPIPDLVPHAYDDVSTDPSPSPPMMYSSLDGQSFTSYPGSATFPPYMDPNPRIVNSIEFTDLTRPQLEDRRRRRRSNTAQDKESVSNMRIRRRAQNRASQRAFRERKEKHVQHLEHELEELENKHRDLTKSYSDLDSNHAQLQREVEQLKSELDSIKSQSREGSAHPSEHHHATTNQKPTAQQHQNHNSDGFYDPFGADATWASIDGSDLGF